MNRRYFHIFPSRIRCRTLYISAAALLGALAAVTPVAPAIARPPAQQPPQPQSTNLGTITVTGSQLQALEEVKAALNRQFSLHAADRKKMVCRVQSPTGSRLEKALVCGTNGAWIKRQEQAQINWILVSMSAGPGMNPVRALQSIRGHNINFELPLRNPAAFQKLMNMLPPKPAATAGSPDAGGSQ